MGLCAIIGSGPVGEYVANRIRNLVPDAKIIGLRDTRPWLSNVAPDAEYVSTLEFGRCLRLAKQLGATEVIFVGEPFGSFRLINDGAMLVYLMIKKMSLWVPHTVLEAIQDMLRDNNIVLRSPLDYFPSLTPEVGLTAGCCNGYDPEADLRTARSHIITQPWRAVRQACVVDQGKVIASETIGRTNGLIRQFGSSPDRQRAVFPVLCKVATPPFEKIDVPTVGVDTIRLCVENGIRAVVVESGRSILMQRNEVLDLANSGSICFYAL